MKRAALALALVLVACGDVYIDTARSALNGGGPTVATDPTQTIPHDDLVACPLTRPDEDSPCNGVGSTCEYGESPDPSCNTTLACEGDESGLGAWTPRPSQLCSLAQCPTGNVAAISGQPCDLPEGDAGPPRADDELQCPMSDGICACTNGPDAAHAHPRIWVCVKPELGCPTARPLAGQACIDDTLCDYGSCLFKRGLRMQCKDGVWITGGSASCG
ncbi:MAG TPA: hypothetical protein VIF62_28400 [Labilithrix sp.]